MRYAALLRAVNVGGTGKLAMADLAALCTGLGYDGVRTYLASGNVVLNADASEDSVQAALEDALLTFTGRAVPVFVRGAAELAAVLRENPFGDTDPKKVHVHFLHQTPRDPTEGARHWQDERIAPGRRAVYVAYPSGMGKSRLLLPGLRDGTARNLNTVAKLAELAADG